MTVVGLIFGVFQLTMIIASPIYGSFITVVGAKCLYVTGIVVCGSATIAFGFLDNSPAGVAFAILGILIRVVQGLGAAAIFTSSFTLIASIFPDRVAMMFGTLELFSGVGMMIGPPVGGALFQLGGFLLPFISLGSFIVLVGFVSYFILHSPEATRLSRHSALALLKIPVVFIMCVFLVCGCGAIGFIDATLAVHLEKQYRMSPIVRGAVFVVGPAVYALTTPLWGWIVDTIPRFNKAFLCIGFTLSGVGFYLIGPAPFFSIPHMLWLLIVCMALMGLGISTIVVTFQVILKATIAKGYPYELETYGLVSGIFSTFFALGAFLGPFGGGYLLQTLGFEMASVVMGNFTLGAVLLLLMYMFITWAWERCAPEKKPLLGDGHVIRKYSDERPDGAR